MSAFKHCLLAATIVFPWTIAVDAQKEKPAEDVVKKLQGLWQVTKFIDHSEQAAPADEIKEMVFEFKEDRITQRKSKEDPGRPGKYTVNAAKQPKWMDIDFGGRVSEGIYKLEGDELSLCFVGGMRGGKITPRPTEFKANMNPPHSLFVLKKIKR